MNRKGYTLIEVIMVIAIISLLALILIPSSLLVIDKAKENSCEKLKGNIISAAKMYVNDSKYEMNFECKESTSKQTISLQELVDTGYLTAPLKNPVSGNEIKLSNKVTVQYDCTKKEFSYDNIKINCTKSK